MDGEVLFCRSLAFLSSSKFSGLGFSPSEENIIRSRFQKDLISLHSASKGNYFGEECVFESSKAVSFHVKALSNQVTLIKIPLSLLKLFPTKALTEMAALSQDKSHLRDQAMRNVLLQKLMLVTIGGNFPKPKLEPPTSRKVTPKPSQLWTKASGPDSSLILMEKQRMSLTLERIALLNAPRVDLNGHNIRRTMVNHTHRGIKWRMASGQPKKGNTHQLSTRTDNSLRPSERQPEDPSRRLLDLFRSRRETLKQNSNFFIIRNQKRESESKILQI